MSVVVRIHSPPLPSRRGDNGIRILFLTQARRLPSTRRRVLQLIPHLEKAGYQCASEPLAADPLGRWRQFRRAREFDLVILQKHLPGRLWTRLLRKHARRLVYEFDDPVFLRRNPVGLHRGRLSRFADVVRRSDAVIASNDYLASYAKKYTDDWRVKILPTSVDLSVWPRKHVHVPPKRIVIGWMGSAAELPYLEPVKPGLRKICEAFPHVTLKIVCDAPFRADGVRVDQKPFVEAEEAADILSFDIALASYPDDAWTMGETPLFLLHYLAAGLPVVATDATCVRRFILDHTNGLLVTEPEDWERKLGVLIEAWGLAIDLGNAARRTMEKLYNVERVIKGYLSVFQSLR